MDKGLEETKKMNENEQQGLRFGNLIGAGFGFIVAGFLAKYLLGMFKNVPMIPDPQISSIFISLGIIVVVVALATEILTSLKN
ncbi:hypothetical protein C9439_04495 [archaeon SCG-AAA382B04]|nr:hypothetical protein C9439_04495 [archaeon SCG-AAA382B04]